MTDMHEQSFRNQLDERFNGRSSDPQGGKSLGREMAAVPVLHRNPEFLEKVPPHSAPISAVGLLYLETPAGMIRRHSNLDHPSFWRTAFARPKAPCQVPAQTAQAGWLRRGWGEGGSGLVLLGWASSGGGGWRARPGPVRPRAHPCAGGRAGAPCRHSDPDREHGGGR